jgi:hypothetical protein
LKGLLCWVRGLVSMLTNSFISHSFDSEEHVWYEVERSDTVPFQCVLWFVYQRRVLFQMVWLERAIIACCCFVGSCGSWIAYMLVDDLYADLVSPFSMFNLDCGTRKGRLACFHLLQGVDGTWTRFRVDRWPYHRIEDLWLVLGLIRGWSTYVVFFLFGVDLHFCVDLLGLVYVSPVFLCIFPFS